MKNLSKNKINKVGEPIEKVGMDDERIFGITKLKLQAFSLPALEIILGDRQNMQNMQNMQNAKKDF